MESRTPAREGQRANRRAGAAVAILSSIALGCTTFAMPRGIEGTYRDSPTRGGVVFAGDIITIAGGRYAHDGFSDEVGGECAPDAVPPCEPYVGDYEVRGNRITFLRSRLNPPERIVVRAWGSTYMLTPEQYAIYRWLPVLPDYALRKQ